MKIRIISDLHLDINEDISFSLPKDDVFTVICGDISGAPAQTIKWIKQNLSCGVFVEGNHIGYASEHSIQYIEGLLAQQFPTTAPVTYLNNTYKIVDDIVFVGGILWTDFCLNGKEWKTLYKMYASQLMNDFRYNYSNAEHLDKETEQNFKQLLIKQQIRCLRPSDTEQMFQHSLKNIKTICERFSDKTIVIVTHHAPSILSIPEIYLAEKNTPAFASNLEQFILEHPNIKLWCHGHIHTACDYQIGNCRVVCNPRGYVKLKEKCGFRKNLLISI